MPPSRTSAQASSSKAASSLKAAKPAAKKAATGSTNAIDAIFSIPSASKAVKAKAANAAESKAATPGAVKKVGVEAQSAGTSTKGKGRAPPTTILDPSANKASTGKRKGDAVAAPPPQLDEEDAAFLDSRGTRKRTEDGFRVFTEDELGLTKNLTGGGTPLCPFDCDCCF